MSLRTDKVASVVNRMVSTELVKLAPDQFFSITEVRVSADLKYATLWVSALGLEAKPPEELQEILDSHIGHLQRLLASHMKSKFTPRLEFKIDRGAKHAEAIKNKWDGNQD